jgi:DNA-binding beta-propeller fold protein YncE
MCLFVLLVYAPAQSRSQSSLNAGPFLLVANQGGRDLSIIDPSSAKQIAVVEEKDVTGHEVAASPDGRTVYVPIYGNSGVGLPGTNGNHMLVIDVVSRKIIGDVNFGHGVRPHCVVYDRANNLIFVTTELDNAVTIVDPRSLTVAGKIPTSQPQSHMLAISHNGSRGYTANVGPGTVSVLDMKGRKTLAVIPISPTVQRISISPDDQLVFTSDQTKPQLAVIDTHANKLKTWVPLPAAGYGTASTRDGRWLLVAIPSINKVAVVDMRSLKVSRTIDTPRSPQEILVRPDGLVAYVSCNRDKQVVAIDLTQWRIQSLIDAGAGADGLAWAGN